MGLRAGATSVGSPFPTPCCVTWGLSPHLSDLSCHICEVWELRVPPSKGCYMKGLVAQRLAQEKPSVSQNVGM